ncbi:hypothetical protein JL107_09875 [Nakamurella flavida]|uniref:Uncharacterized protein n=1 Tax=Nakamurella flavida TaxID=363630 RepID=A0A938YIU0_9ACTN|nr:hypothetical protein [Nakamurella flavida]MBM9476752.1 hypothetical protein [Nakamurella flavida]MDP9778810.1 phosphopantothenoylcysteine decarboxylase/phosphopantothenate--cysteine ligase [Nakamurella flavida]
MGARSSADRIALPPPGVGDTPQPPRQFGTDLLRTRVSGDGTRGFEWVRRPGPAAPAGFVDPAASTDPAVVELAGADLPDCARPVLGVPLGDGRRYRVDGPVAVASVLLYSGGGAELTGSLQALGRTLRHLHALTPAGPATALGPPRGLLRLTRWLDGFPAAGDADDGRTRLRARLGVRRWDDLRGWAAALLAGPTVLSHGAPGLGSLVPGRAGAAPALLTGEDLAAASWEWDVGWVVGELVELCWQLGTDTGLRALLGGLFEGYGRDLGTHWHRAAALRIALHVHDFSAYTRGSADILLGYGDFLAFLIDQDTDRPPAGTGAR